MDDSGPELAKQVAALAGSFRLMEARVAALEGAAVPASPRLVAVPPAEQVPTTSTAPEHTPPARAALAGRSLFVLAGAFVFRALTDSGALPRGVGVALGLAYALTWLVAADRTAREGSATAATAATAWGVTALVIACPLVWEASTRFDVLPPAGAAGVLLAGAVAALAVSVRRNLSALAWVSVLSTFLTAIVLLVSTHALVAFAALLVSLTAASWAVSARCGWPGLPWAPAAAADLVVLELVWIASRQGGIPEAYTGLSSGAVLALSLALFAASLAGRVRRAFGLDEEPDAFAAVQSGAALFLMVLAVSRLIPMAGLPPALVWVVAGFATAVAPPRAVGSLAPAYGAILLVAAAIASGLGAFAAHAFVGAPVAAMPSPDSVLVLSASAAVTALLARRVRAGTGGRALRGAMFALACVSIVEIGALAEWGLAQFAAPDGDAGRTACVRSAVLAATSVLLASCGHLSTLSGLARLVYPVLAFSAFKLLFEDLRHGRPSTLAATFVLYGAALMIVPRILRFRRA
jgi:hypothetical protein